MGDRLAGGSGAAAFSFLASMYADEYAQEFYDFYAEFFDNFNDNLNKTLYGDMPNLSIESTIVLEVMA